MGSSWHIFYNSFYIRELRFTEEHINEIDFLLGVLTNTKTIEDKKRLMNKCEILLSKIMGDMNDLE